MKKIVFVGSECYPFVKTGGLGDVMSALPKALLKEQCDVRVFLPNYRCIPEKYRKEMKYVNHFYMDIGRVPGKKYVGILTLELDGVTYYFIDNEEYFSAGNPYESMSKDIEKYIFFDKAVLAALPVIGFEPDIIHCHDWQTGFIPVFLRTLFYDTELSRKAKTILTVHNLKFQGIANIDTVRYLTAFPEYVFEGEKAGYGNDVNMLKAGLVFADKITTVSQTYCDEIKTEEYGETLHPVINYHHMKLCGILNGIDYEVYNPKTDQNLSVQYNVSTVVDAKRENKLALQEELGLEKDGGKFIIGLISRLTDQKGLDLVNQIMEKMIDEHTQFVLIGTGDTKYENIFRSYENRYKGRVSSNIMYSDARARRLYAAADVMLVPSRFEPCGLTQMMAYRYGAIPVVRATGGLKDSVAAYNEVDGTGTGFSFTDYSAKSLLDTVNYAKRIYFTRNDLWRELVIKVMNLDYSWKKSASQYKNLYVAMSGADEEPEKIVKTEVEEAEVKPEIEVKEEAEVKPEIEVKEEAKVKPEKKPESEEKVTTKKTTRKRKAAVKKNASNTGKAFTSTATKTTGKTTGKTTRKRTTATNKKTMTVQDEKQI